MIAIKELGSPLTDEHITNLEGELGTTLPDQYRRFLLRTNGGRPSPPGTYAVDIDGAPWSSTDIHSLLGLDVLGESCDLDWYRHTLSERIPDNMLPVARDSGGSVFCLSLRGPDRGAVFFCDLQSVYGDFEATPKFYPVASDFEGFLEKIHPFA